MRSPFSPLHLLVFILAIAFLVAFVQIGALTIAFDKLGLSAQSAFALLIVSLIGSGINLPLFTIDSRPPPVDLRMSWSGLLRAPQRPYAGKTTIAVNVGGGLIPLSMSFYLLGYHTLNFGHVLLATALVSVICRLASRPIAGIGIGMPIFIAPVSAAVLAILIDPDNSAPLAYICGTMGVLIGADLLRLPDIRSMGVPLASIGGAGTFDGIFITGIVAVLLA